MLINFEKNPTTADKILFELETLNENGMLEGPISVDRVVIYYIEVKIGGNHQSLKQKHYSNELKEQLQKLQKEAAVDPSDDKIARLRFFKNQMENSACTTALNFHEAVPVMIMNGNNLKTSEIGKFSFEWSEEGLRDGEYILYWEWTNQSRIKASNYRVFHIKASNQDEIIGEKLKYTPTNKYRMLLDLYTPSTYKYKLHPDDETPEIINKLHECAADGFTLLEDLVNQLGDMLDANLAHESILPLLANFFNLKLRTNNTKLWRQQIKNAVPLLKSKGTLDGLTKALAESGIKLVKLTKLWQVVSKYSWTDTFTIKQDITSAFGENIIKVSIGSIIGNLSYKPLNKNLEIHLKTDKDYIKLPIESIDVINPLDVTDKHLVIWQGVNLQTPIDLFVGDVLTIKYLVQPIPKEKETIEKYIESLPVDDFNRNVHLIEEDDPLFDIIVENRHPITDDIIFGKIRTTFLYSENVYNMDAYNGTLRDSKNRCDIDDSFVDSCSYCQSSKFNVDLEISDPSDEKIEEAKEIIKDYSPFHALLHSINVNIPVKDFFIEPTERLQSIVEKDNENNVTPKEKINFLIEWSDGTTEEGTL